MTYVIPVIIYATVFGEHAFLFYVIIIKLNLATMLLNIKEGGMQLLSKWDQSENNDSSILISIKTLEDRIIKLSISLVRASVFIIACVVIIAVDFQIFPRIHAKTSEFGFSLMDMGNVINIYY